MQSWAARRKLEERGRGGERGRGLVQIQGQGFDTIAVRTSGAWRKEGDGRDNSRVGHADGVVDGDLATAKVGGPFLGEGGVGDEIGEADSREGRGALGSGDSSRGRDVEVDAPHATAGRVVVPDRALGPGRESMLDRELDGGGVNELFPQLGEEDRGEGRIVGRDPTKAIEVDGAVGAAKEGEGRSRDGVDQDEEVEVTRHWSDRG